MNESQKKGEAVFKEHCASCHSLIPDSIVVGPSLAGVASRAGNRVPGMDADEYMHASILEPESYLVDGYKNLMPATFSELLTQEEIEALVSFLQTLE